jgi:hypothetical protein
MSLTAYLFSRYDVFVILLLPYLTNFYFYILRLIPVSSNKIYVYFFRKHFRTIIHFPMKMHRTLKFVYILLLIVVSRTNYFNSFTTNYESMWPSSATLKVKRLESHFWSRKFKMPNQDIQNRLWSHLCLIEKNLTQIHYLIRWYLDME